MARAGFDRGRLHACLFLVTRLRNAMQPQCREQTGGLFYANGMVGTLNLNTVRIHFLSTHRGGG